MKAIWKYDIPIDGEVHDIAMPQRARIVHVERQPSGSDTPWTVLEHLTFWAEVDKDAYAIRRHFRVVGTGHNYSEGEYVGTMLNGPLVFHLLELK